MSDELIVEVNLKRFDGSVVYQVKGDAAKALESTYFHFPIKAGGWELFAFQYQPNCRLARPQEEPPNA